VAEGFALIIGQQDPETLNAEFELLVIKLMRGDVDRSLVELIALVEKMRRLNPTDDVRKGVEQTYGVIRASMPEIDHDIGEIF